MEFAKAVWNFAFGEDVIKPKNNMRLTAITYTASRDYMPSLFGLDKQPKLKFNLGCL